MKKTAGSIAVEIAKGTFRPHTACAAAAFKTQKKERLSLSEARDIVEKFMKSEVK